MNLVLAHGVLGFDRFGPIRYFNSMADVLRATFQGCRVLIPVALPLGHRGTSSRCTCGRRFVRGAKFCGRGARHRSQHGRPPREVPSIERRAWIGPPDQQGDLHRHPTSGLACDHNSGQGQSARAAAAPVPDGQRSPGRALREPRRSPRPVLRGGPRLQPALSRHRSSAICRGRRPRPRGCPLHTSKFFQLTFTFLAATVGANDGIVPFESATRGRPPLAVCPGGHLDLIGHDLDDLPSFRNRSFDQLTAYDQLVRDVIAPHDH